MDDLQFVERLITKDSDGEPVAALGAEITVYWRGSMYDRADELISLYRRFVAAEGAGLKYFETGTMSGARPLKSDTLDVLPFWLNNNKRKKDIFLLHLFAARSKSSLPECGFLFAADEEDGEPLGAIRISLPAVSLSSDAAGFVERVVDWVGDLDFESGHAGFGLEWDPRGDNATEAQDSMARIAAQCYGIDLYDLDVTFVAMRETRPAGIKCVSWLTLLGNTLLSAASLDPSSLAGRLAGKCSLHSLPKGIIVQAGPAPTIGRINLGRGLESYKAIGGLLAPYRFKEHQSLFSSLVDGEEEAEGTLRWLARFDG